MMQSVLRSRIMYAYIVTLLLGLALLYFADPVLKEISLALDANTLTAKSRDLISSFASALVFFAVFVMSRRIPAMIGPGTAGYFLSKPLSRTRLLTYTLLSSMIVNASIIGLCMAIFGAALLIILPAGPSGADIALQISLEILVLMIYAPILFFLGLLTRSGSYAFMICFTIWLVAWVLPGREGFLMFFNSDILSALADALYYVLPKSSKIVEFAYPRVSGLQAGLDWMPIWSSALSALGAYGLGIIRFRRMDL